MKKLIGENSEPPAPGLGSDPEVAGVGNTASDVGFFSVAAILAMLGVNIENPEGFEVVLKIERRKEPGGNYVNRFSRIPNPMKPESLATGEKFGVPGGHSPVGPECD